MRHLILVVHTRARPERLLHVLKEVAALLAVTPNAEALLISDVPLDRSRPPFSESQTDMVRFLQNSTPQGPGGNQKIGFRYAAERGFEVVSVVHSSSFSDQQTLVQLWKHVETTPTTDCMLAIPRKWYGWNSIVPNWLAGVRFKGWFAELRIYRVSALQKIAFELNANDRVFETEILLQLVEQRGVILDFPVPEPCIRPPVKVSLKKFLKAVKACLKYRLQKYNLFYDFRYHPEEILSGIRGREVYEPKLDFNSPHAFVCRDSSAIPDGTKVLDIGSSSGYIARALSAEKCCQVTAIDRLPAAQVDAKGFDYLQFDLEVETDRLCEFIAAQDFDVILMLDVLEHLAMPEVFLLKLYRIPYKKKPRFIFSTGNVSFFVVRLMLLFGYFNYGQKGILDVTHKRLFSWRTFQNLFDQTGFVVVQKRSFPAPYRFLGLGPVLSRFCESLNKGLIYLRPSLFAYQILLIAVPFDSPEHPLDGLE